MNVINLYGAPGSGKSTGAAYIFSKLKLAKVSVELVTEFAKDLVWSGEQEAFKNQAFLFGTQSYRLSRLIDKVDWVITDSPLMLSLIYNDNKYFGEDFYKAVEHFEKNAYTAHNFFIERDKPYVETGRNQTEKESDFLKYRIKDMLWQHKIDVTTVKGNEEGYEQIIEYVLERK